MQLSYIIVDINSTDLKYKFITEAQTVMYENLFRYYGYEDSSFIFMEGIDRLNL